MDGGVPCFFCFPKKLFESVQVGVASQGAGSSAELAFPIFNDGQDAGEACRQPSFVLSLQGFAAHVLGVGAKLCVGA